MALANIAAAGNDVLYVSGEESAAQVRTARRAARGGGALGADARRALAGVGAGGAGVRAPGRLRDRLGPDAGDPGRRAGQRGRRPRGDLGAARDREAARRHPDPDRPRDQGGLAGGAARPRAPGRLRPALRGRAGADLPHPARAQEPLRRNQRGRRLRDAAGRPRRGRGPIGALRRRGQAGPRIGRALRDGGDAPAAGRGAGTGRADRDRARRAARRRASIATGWRSSWRC